MELLYEQNKSEIERLVLQLNKLKKEKRNISRIQLLDTFLPFCFRIDDENRDSTSASFAREKRKRDILSEEVFLEDKIVELEIKLYASWVNFLNDIEIKSKYFEFSGKENYFTKNNLDNNLRKEYLRRIDFLKKEMIKRDFL